MNLKFSIIIPTYNRAALISKAIQSIVDQTYANWELIIIDDGSTDETPSVIKAFDDSRIKYYWQENQERSVARNNGIQESTGNWICFLDSDDAFSIDYLETLVNVISPEDEIIRSRLSFIDKNGQTTQTTARFNNRNSQQFFVANTFDSVLSYAFKREILEDYSFHNINSWEDKDLIINILNKHSFKAIDYVSVLATNHSGRSINTFHQDISAVKNILERMKKTLATAKYLTKNQKQLIYDKKVYSLIHNAVYDKEFSSWKMLKATGFKFRYVLRWSYYSIKKM